MKNCGMYLYSIILILLQFCYVIKDIIPKNIQLFLYVTFILIIYLKNYKNKILNAIICINLYITICICISRKISFDYFSPVNTLIQFFMLLLGYSLYLSIKNCSLKRKKVLLFLVWISLVISILISLYYVFFIDRQAIRNTQRQYLFAVGDFELMYALSFVEIGIIAIMKKYKAICLFLTFLFSLVIVKSNLVTSCVIFFLCFVLLLLFYIRQEHSKKFLKVFLLFLLLFIFFRKYLVLLFNYLATLDFFYWSTQNKLKAISNVLSFKINSDLDTLTLRGKLIKQSLNTFKNNFWIGESFSNIRVGVLGGHSQWPDLLAQFGITSVIIIWLFYEIYKVQKKYIKDKKKVFLLKTMWFLFFILGFLNPNLMGAVIYAMLVVIPLSIECANKY